MRGAFEAGATEVVVADAHGTMQNLLPDELDQRARLVAGAPRPLSMVDSLDATFAAVVFIGFHARAGAAGVMSHTYNGGVFAEVRIDGRAVGETELFANVAREIGVPLALVTGDDRLAAELAVSLPNVRTAIVKRCRGGWASNNLSPTNARSLIEQSVLEALGMDLPRCPPIDKPEPIYLEIDLVKQFFADACSLLPMVERRTPHSVALTVDDYKAAVGAIQALSYLAMGALR